MFGERKCTFYAKWTIWIVVTFLIMTIFIFPQSCNAETTKRIDVVGADKQTEEVIEILEDKGGSVVFASDGAVSLDSRSIAKDKVVLSYSRKIYYEDFFTRNYRVKYDDKTMVAYCVQPKVQPPAEGSWTATEYNSKLMTKALYYSYGYPGYDKKMRPYISKRDIDDDYTDDDGAYALSHLILSYFYDKQSINSDAFLGVSNDTKKTVIKIADLIENTWPEVPDNSALSLDKTSVEAVWNKELQKQKTPVMKLKGHEDNKIKVTIPKYTTMIKTSDGVTKKYYRGEDNSSKVRVYGGDSFYFTAEYDKKGSFTSGEMKGSLSDFQPYLIKIEGKQDIIYCGVGETDSVSFKIKWDEVGKVELKKESADAAITRGNSCYSLKNAEYQILDHNGKVYETLTTDSEGEAIVKLPYGKYTLKESKAPKGYLLDEMLYDLTVNSAEKITVKDVPVVISPEVLLWKKDKETGLGEGGEYGASLKDAEYEVCFYAGFFDEKTDFNKLTPENKWIVKTNDQGKLKLENTELPLGTLTIKETKAPKGYLLDETTFVRQVDETFDVIDHEEQIIRGDVKLLKQAEGQDGFLQGVTFRITSRSTGESCLMTTDEYGVATTQYGAVWIGEKSAKSNQKGALPYDTYIIDEIRNENNFGFQLVEGVEVVIDQDKAVVDLGIVTDKKISIETTASDKDTGSKNILAGRKTEIRDVVSYQGLVVGREYVLKGLIIDKETGKIIENDGVDVEAKTQFKATDEKGTVNVDFTFDSRGFEDKSLVIYEYLYEKGTLIASHEDIDSISQTVSIQDKESPATGDNVPFVLIAGLIIIALFGAVSIIRIE